MHPSRTPSCFGGHGNDPSLLMNTTSYAYDSEDVLHLCSTLFFLKDNLVFTSTILVFGPCFLAQALVRHVFVSVVARG